MLSALQEVGMEKISSILPGTARVTSVDMKESNPVRSGAPGFGRAEAHMNRERTSPEGIRQAAENQLDTHDWRSKDVKHAAIAKDMADKFFAKNKKDVEDVGPVSDDRISSTAGMQKMLTKEVGEENQNMESEIEAGISNPEKLSQPAGLHPKGSFINYTA
jgi:hypothetical protein